MLSEVSIVIEVAYLFSLTTSDVCPARSSLCKQLRLPLAECMSSLPQMLLLPCACSSSPFTAAC